ncbi:MAG: hypothetical protein Q8S21_06310 [Candidatus Paracaedibacteraceae bacterium]|nr:hypothetical protein [Candidatus Paracaedibacteraceae bacterium]
MENNCNFLTYILNDPDRIWSVKLPKGYFMEYFFFRRLIVFYKKFSLLAIICSCLSQIHAAQNPSYEYTHDEGGERLTANKLGSFLTGFKQGVESELSLYQPSTKAAERSDMVAQSLKLAGNIAFVGASRGSATPGVGETIFNGLYSPVVDLGLLITKAIIQKHEEEKGKKNAKLTKVFEPITKSTLSAVMKMGSLAENVTSTYAEIIKYKVDNEEKAEKLGEAAGQIIIDYILNPPYEDKEMQAYDIWEDLMRGMVMWGDKQDTPAKYTELANKLLDDAFDDPSSKFQARSEFLRTLEPEKLKAYWDVIVTSSDETLFSNSQDLTNAITAKKSRLDAYNAATPENKKNYFIQNYNHHEFPMLTRKEYIKDMCPENREKYLFSLLESPRANEMDFLGYLLKKELVRCLDFHTVTRRKLHTLNVHKKSPPDRTSIGYLQDSSIRSHTFNAEQAVVFHTYQNSSPRNHPTNEALNGTRDFYAHKEYPSLDDEIYLLNEMLKKVYGVDRNNQAKYLYS